MILPNQIVVIDGATQGLEGTTRHVINYLNKKHIQPHLISIFHQAKMMPETEFYEALKNIKPDLIIFIGVLAWKYADTLKACDGIKVNLWFDDPVMRIEGMGFTEAVKSCSRLSDFEFYVWDNYWADECMIKFGMNAKIMHLAEDGDEYFECDTQLSDECVFIGGLHSMGEIQKRRQWVNKVAQKIIDSSMNYVSNFKGEIPSWDVVESEAKSGLSAGDLRLFQDIEKLDPGEVLQMRWCIWAHSKNEVRIRALREVLKASPLMIFTDMRQKGHANEGELRYFIGDFSKRLKVVDTSGAKTMAHLYHYGALHIGATDPQSVKEGIPYRNFQTMASGRPLLTDIKPGWSEALKATPYYAYGLPDEIEEKVSEILRDKKGMKDMGHSSRMTFELHHTWDHRLASIIFRESPSFRGLKPTQLADISALTFYNKNLCSK